MPGENLLNVLRNGSKWAAIAAGLLIVVSSVLITIDVFARLLANQVLVQSFEVSRYLFAIAVASSLALAAIDKAHIRIDLFVNLMAMKWRALIGVAAMASLAIVGSYFAWRGYLVAVMSFQIGARPVSGFPVPLWIPQTAWVLGLVWFAVVCVLLTIIGLRMVSRKSWTEANDLLGTTSIEDEIDQATDGVAAPESAGGTKGANS
ncbi:MAG TPA: TRAP transporter small permease [Devosia sp.]|jgi:TRAP-type C4-dicarboxylate transport system permease small subunit|nr:TRAP transporter small permease [Devosia sp.]